MPSEPSCFCCGVPRRVYEVEGHDRECTWYEDEMYRLAVGWKGCQEKDANWKQRYDLIVGFLLEQIRCIKENN